MSTERVFERKMVSKRRTSVKPDSLVQVTETPIASNGSVGTSNDRTASWASSGNVSGNKYYCQQQHKRTPFQPHPDSNCDWFFKNKIISVDESKVKLQIWDTAGQERFRSVTHAYYRDAHALLLLYDVTNKTSFDNIRAWLSEIRDYANDHVVIMLLGNKADCHPGDRMIKKEDGEKLAKEYSVTFMETSAKSGLNVEVAFMAVARELLFKKTGVENKESFNVQDYVREQTKANCSSCFPA
ncbi:ras-related protein Rab-37 isoform X3 [Adelges cooleyi]|uniref:ras-related protein Rab-37 isoform X3 n=1 Tax=Adelges cooleyi TaxID=133065 RepID=UPI00218064AD|nr:ras-related protein Rab-37 isoform X3 [Adelges cooleyi]